MIYHLLILIVNSFVSFYIASYIAKKIGRSNRYLKMSILVLLYVILAKIHFKVYMEGKKSNYYEIMKINENYTSRELKKAQRECIIFYHPDKVKDPSKKKEMEEIYI